MERKAEQAGLRTSITTLLLMLCMAVGAQDDVEYKMEMGATVGTSFYLGDANSTPFAHMSGMGGLIARRVLNPRMAVKTNLLFGHISGSSDGYFIPTDPNSNSAEGGIPTTVHFSRNLLDVGAQFEMNFWGFGMGTGYKEHSRITPYALAGVGLTVGMGGGGGTCGALNLPVGLGVKYKVKPRLNIGLEWTVRFSTSDELDASRKGGTQLAHPYGVKSKGLKNKDCYSFTMFYLTYDMCPKLRKCNN